MPKEAAASKKIILMQVIVPHYILTADAILR
jgi:hypothetical protein